MPGSPRDTHPARRADSQRDALVDSHGRRHPGRLPSLIASDLDGTLLDARGRVGAANRQALERAHALGIPVLLTTGRPVRWLADVDVLRPVQPHVICSNGAVRFNLATGEIEEQHVMDPETTLQVARAMRERVPGARLGVELGARWGHEPDFPLRDDGVVADVVAPIEQLVHEPVVKLLVVSDELDSEHLAAELVPLAHGRLEATWSMTGGRGLVEVCALGVSKASSLLRLCDELGIDPADAVAFGDMPNDLAMLQAVGHPHVMANAHPVMHREAARHDHWGLAPHHDQAGVARVLNTWFDSLGV